MAKMDAVELAPRHRRSHEGGDPARAARRAGPEARAPAGDAGDYSSGLAGRSVRPMRNGSMVSLRPAPPASHGQAAEGEQDGDGREYAGGRQRWRLVRRID